MNQQTSRLSLSVWFLQVVRTIYFDCSESTRQNFGRLRKALFFTVLICGSILAASFCEFWLGRDYTWMPLIFLGTGLFYYLLDQAIIMGDNRRRGSGYKWLRISIALVLGLFNSFLIDYYFFKADILAARQAEIRQKQEAVRESYAFGIREKEGQKAALYSDIDGLQARLSAQLDSLNAEATGLGGSHKSGIATVWMAKYRAYQADSTSVAAQVGAKQAAIVALDAALKEDKAKMASEAATVDGTVSAGINKSLELLHRIVWLEGNFTNIFMSILILLVSMLIELVPLLTKDFYDVEEYFERIQAQKELLLANTALRQQNAISKEAAQLANENALMIADQSSRYKVQMMTQDLEHSKRVMQATETYMDELEMAEAAWKKKYPSLYEQYGQPVIDKAYKALSLATEKVSS